jgi:predicted metal-dependent peptidase
MAVMTTVEPSDKVIKRVARAKIELLDKHPLFGLLLMQINTVYTDRCETCATDGTNLFINPSFIEGISDVELLGVAIHETLHVIFKHHLRKGNRDNTLFNIVADVIINEYVKANKGHLPDGCWDWDKCKASVANKPEVVDWLNKTKFDQVSVEELFAKVADFIEEDEEGNEQGEGNGPSGNDDGDDEDTKSDDDGDDEDTKPDDGDGPIDDGDTDENVRGEGGNQDGGSAQIEDVGNQGSVIQATNEHGQPLDDREIEEASRDLDQKIFNAAEMAKARGLLPAWAEGMLEELRDPQVPWADKLHRSVKECGKQHVSDWNRRDKKAAGRGVFFPRRTKQGAGIIAVGVDTSGSVLHNGNAYEALISEVVGIAEDVQPEEVIIIYCDADVSRVDRFDDPQDIDPSAFVKVGGGGTRFDPPFKWLEENDIEPDAFIYLTDMYAPFPDEPDYPTIWVSCSKGKEAPFGETIEITVD